MENTIRRLFGSDTTYVLKLKDVFIPGGHNIDQLG